MTGKRAPQNMGPTGNAVTDRALDDTRRVVADIAREAIVSSRTIEVSLPNAVLTKIKHGLGRKLTNCLLSAPQGAVTSGRIVESTPDASLATEFWLTATGYGATVVVRATVF